MKVFPAELENCMQPNLQRPSAMHEERNQFERDYTRKGFRYIMKRYGDMGWRYVVEKYTKKFERAIKRLIRKR